LGGTSLKARIQTEEQTAAAVVTRAATRTANTDGGATSKTANGPTNVAGKMPDSGETHDAGNLPGTGNAGTDVPQFEETEDNKEHVNNLPMDSNGTTLPSETADRTELTDNNDEEENSVETETQQTLQVTQQILTEADYLNDTEFDSVYQYLQTGQLT